MSNYTPATATIVTATPYTVTQDVSAAPTGTGYASSCAGTQYFAVWYRYTTTSVQTLFSVGADSGGYDPVVSIWTGTLPTLTEYAIGLSSFCRHCAGDYFLEVPCTPNTTYYVQIEAATNTTPTDDLTVRVQSAPRITAPIDAVVVPDEHDGFPAAAFSLTTGTFYSLPPCPGGEVGTQLPDGTLGLVNGQASTDPTSLVILNASFVTTATVDFAPNIVRAITSNRSDTFYVVTQAPGFFVNTVRAVSRTGTLGSTWTLPDLASALQVCAVTRDNTIFYSAQSGDQIQRYDLVNDLPLDEWSATFAGESYRGIGDGIVDATGHVWIGYHGSGTNNLRQFDPDGNVLQTVDLTSADFVTLNRYAIDGTDTGILAWGFGTGGAGGTDGYSFRRVAIADGSITATSPVMPSMAESGFPIQAGAPLAVSSSCPVLVLTQPYVPPSPTPSGTTRYTRRVRRFEGPFADNLTVFLSDLEFVIQSGVGLTTGQGADPVLMVRLSKDSGHTWGNEFTVPMGKIGEYTRRARKAGSLGLGRQWVVEVSVSDPVVAAFLECTVTAMVGTS